MRNVAIIGGGRVGSVLGKVLSEERMNIVAVISRSARSAQKAGKFLHCKNVSTSLDSIPYNTDLVFIATPHSAVEDVAGALATVGHLQFKRLAVCHASGMLTASVLNPLKERGSLVFSFHPLQTFPRDFAPKDMVASVKGIYYGVDGTPKALNVARRLARKLGGKTVTIDPTMRALYHAACVVASNHLTTLLWLLDCMSHTLNLKKNSSYMIFKPIIMTTLRNIENTSPAKALSGPIARGGVDTLAKHLASLSHFAPEILPVFALMSIETVKLASVKGSITHEQELALLDVIQANLRTKRHTQETH